ncbi:MAG TPA: 2OG-Fe(II) oxygenase [Thermoanaerobaculia bacterium]|nr:2OG-Fe(II) oxygenase [Thermoanaerobaculia bacterium]
MEDLLLLPAFLHATECRRILEELQAGSGTPATVYGTQPEGTVQSNVRSAMRLAVSSELRELIIRHLDGAREEIERHFAVQLTHCEEPQFLHYRAGDFFVAHQDGNTPLTRDDSRHRRISVVAFLNAQSPDPRAGSYGGGDLLFHGRYPDWQERHAAPAAPGALVAFRSEATHEVTPVTHGDRYTVVSWYR